MDIGSVLLIWLVGPAVVGTLIGIVWLVFLHFKGDTSEGCN